VDGQRQWDDGRWAVDSGSRRVALLSSRALRSTRVGCGAAPDGPETAQRFTRVFWKPGDATFDHSSTSVSRGASWARPGACWRSASGPGWL